MDTDSSLEQEGNLSRLVLLTNELNGNLNQVITRGEPLNQKSEIMFYLISLHFIGLHCKFLRRWSGYTKHWISQP